MSDRLERIKENIGPSDEGTKSWVWPEMRWLVSEVERLTSELAAANEELNARNMMETGLNRPPVDARIALVVAQRDSLRAERDCLLAELGRPLEGVHPARHKGYYELKYEQVLSEVAAKDAEIARLKERCEEAREIAEENTWIEDDNENPLCQACCQPPARHSKACHIAIWLSGKP